MRIADHDFETRGDACFTDWQVLTLAGGIRVCQPDTSVSDCVHGITYSTPMQGFNYSRVCGKIIGYQLGTMEAFAPLIAVNTGIDSHYVNGLSLTYGTPRQHLWTFAIGVTESRTDRFGCPCSSFSTVNTANTFVGDHYFCDSAASQILSGSAYPDRQIWDGIDCRENNQPCCSFNNPPWFDRELPQPTSDDIELRGCRDEIGVSESTLVSSIELYVQ